jgi:hypothetical protein
MEVIFYYNASDDRVINKTLVGGESFVGTPRDEVDIMTPTIRFENSEILRYNYAYIPELQRYYVVNSVNAYREGIWDVSFSVDVLMSFRGDIMTLSVIVDKQTMPENGDEYIDDGSLVTDNVMFTRLHQFESGFNDYPEYILITAG